MRERIVIFIKLYLFWICTLVFYRILFLAYEADYTVHLTFIEVVKVMAYGLRMDLSMAGYFLLICGSLLICSVFLQGQWIRWALLIANIFFIIFCTIIVVVDLELYRHWGFRMNAAPLFYFSTEALESVQPWKTVMLLTVLVIVSWGTIILLKRVISRDIRRLTPTPYPTAIALLVMTGLLFFPIRGSFSVAPMNTGVVYFSQKKPFANHAGINVIWNFLYTVRADGNIKYPENFLDKEETDAYFRKSMEESDSTSHLLTVQHPNIIIIIIESFTSGIIEPLGGLPDITPELNKLCQEGILFKNIYASGDRTDKGIVCVLSGYPAQPLSSIVKFPGKTQSLPFLPRKLNQLGYHTSFDYGGDVDFANMRSYLATAGFENITSIDDFSGALNTAKWGVRDESMFDRVIEEMDSANQPFFKTILTLSSHEPYDVPVLLPGTDSKNEESLFLNACHYTDASLGKFISWCKQQDWWSNTLIVITADHGHRHPGNKSLESKERFSIPLLWIGGAVKQDTIIETIGSQTDIANTLLGQIDHTDSTFIFSRNILSTSPTSFAQFFYEDGYSFVDPDHFIVYDHAGDQFLKKDGVKNEDELKPSKAYAQKLFSDYNSR